MIINVHAGHNPDGKIACGAAKFIKESTEARKVKDEVICLLRLAGHTVYDCTVNDGTSQADVLTKIVKKCNAHKADLDVSIHFNAGAGDLNGNGKTTGTEVLLYSASSGAKVSAERICSKIAELGFRNRGVKYNPNLYVLRKTISPALLVECCFVDDRDDVALYDPLRMAKAIAEGITGRTITPPVTDGIMDPDADDTQAETAVGPSRVLYKVQCGAYGKKENAAALADRLKNAGFDCFVTTV